MIRFKPKASYSDTADALYVYLSDADAVERTQALDDRRMVDFGADGSVVGVEFLDASAGVDLHDVPNAQEIEQLVRSLNLPLYVR